MNMYHTFLSRYPSQLNFSVEDQPMERISSHESMFNNAIILSANIDFNFAIELSNYVAEYQKNSNPAALLAIIKLCDKNKVYPPEFVLNILANTVDEWFENKGTKSLDHLLKLKQRGQNNPFTRSATFVIINLLMQEIWQLKNVFNLSTEKAVEMVASRLEEANKKNADIKIYSADTLVRYYDGTIGEQWRNTPTTISKPRYDNEQKEWVNDEQWIFQAWDTGCKKDCLSRYPSNAIPSELK